MSAKSKWSEFPPFDARKVSWKEYEQNVLSYAAGITDDSGSTIADTLVDMDMGGAAPGAPGMPVVPPALAAAAAPGGGPGPFLLDQNKMARLRQARLSKGYQVLYESISDTDLRRTLFETYRQPPRPSAAFAMLRARFDPVLKQSDIEQKNLEWNGYSITKDVGKSEGR